MLRTGIVRDERYKHHMPGDFHPESPKRLDTIYQMLEEPDMAGRFQDVKAKRVERDELLLIHSPEYVQSVATTEGESYRSLDPDTATSPGSYEAALLAAGGLCEAISMVVTGDLNNAFALVRPPGHHAERGRAMGFCLFNNVAVGARYAQKVHDLKRILIVDWDLHHGNGTQHSFETDSTVLYFSTHQFPHYPGTGAFQESGHDQGEGFTLNIPLSAGNGDGEYVGYFERILKPVSLEFKPELILVSAGFDIGEDDPLGGMRVTSEGFAALTQSVLALADECCGGKVILTLEGGYSLTCLRDSVKAVLNELSGLSKTPVEQVIARGNQQMINRIVEKTVQIHGKFWKNLTRENE